MSDDPLVKVARDLTEILRLYGELEAQAINDSDSRLMPGGRAMIELGPVTNLERWEHMTEASERLGRAYTSAEDEDPDEAWSAFQLIEFWAESWRRDLNAEYDGMRPTIATEANFVRHALDWAWENEPGWDDMARDMNRARVRLEDILTEGTRVERSRVVCDDCETAPRLILAHRGIADDRSDDEWKCPECRKRFGNDALHRAHARMLRSAGAERWVHQTDAIGTLKAQGRSERTVRQWLAEGEGEGFCDPVTHEVWVWWPSLWRRHLMTETRRRESRRQEA